MFFVSTDVDMSAQDKIVITHCRTEQLCGASYRLLAQSGRYQHSVFVLHDANGCFSVPVCCLLWTYRTYFSVYHFSQRRYANLEAQWMVANDEFLCCRCLSRLVCMCMIEGPECIVKYRKISLRCRRMRATGLLLCSSLCLDWMDVFRFSR